MSDIYISVRPDCACSGIIPIGKQGEKGANKVIFDMGWYKSRYGDGIPKILVRRPFDNVPVAVSNTTIEGDTIIWFISEHDTAHTGDGELIVEWHFGENLSKSATYQTHIEKSLIEGSEGDNPSDPGGGGGTSGGSGQINGINVDAYGNATFTIVGGGTLELIVDEYGNATMR